MIGLIETNKDYRKWCKENYIDKQIRCISSWMDYEEYGEIVSLDLEQVISLYCFLHFVVGVEFLQDVYDMIEEERADGEHDTERLVKMFNCQMGKAIIEY